MADESLDLDLMRNVHQLRAIEVRMRAGLIEPLAVRRLLEDIVKGKYPGLPAWYVLPEQQLERMREINDEREWGFKESDFPAETPNFMPLTLTDVLLLAVYLPDKGKRTGVLRTIDEQLEVIEQQYLQRGYNRVHRLPAFKTDSANLRLHPKKVHRPGIRWVAYDHATLWNARHGQYVTTRLGVEDIPTLVASEVFSALMLFPEYGPSMDGEYPITPGYQVRMGEGWSGTPYAYWAHKDEPDGPRLQIGAKISTTFYKGYAPPVVRDLS